MKFSRILAFAIGVVLLTGAGPQSDEQIKQAIIRESLASYPGNCPCPYNSDRAGRSCGARSAYSRPGGYSPICYAKDVTKAQVEAYRQSHNQAKR